VYECINLFVFFLLTICDTLRLSTTPYSEGNQRHLSAEARQVGRRFPSMSDIRRLFGGSGQVD